MVYGCDRTVFTTGPKIHYSPLTIDLSPVLLITHHSFPSSIKMQRKHRSPAFYRLHLDISFVKHHDLFAEAKADAAAAFFGAEKRDEDLVYHFFGHA